jgi:prepilin-type N-terminal cleavage/methylation domain-containing protein
MQKSKSAFTIIELIFVIVILGILAVVAIPRLASTRDDADIVKIAQNIMLGAAEISSYAVSKGNTTVDLTEMSNGIAKLVDDGDAILASRTATIAVGSVLDCVTLQVASGVNDENLTISFGNPGADNRCQTMQSVIDVQDFPMQLRGTRVRQ